MDAVHRAVSRPSPRTSRVLLLATGRLIGEGFDDARLDTLFLTLPVSWHGTIAQYAGRLHRLHVRKREVRVMDYADLNVPMLARMFDRRCRGYEAVGYTILAPASAVPGWPAEVPLPVDPQWKTDYAASVRRLVRDGVDTPLANLFVHVTRQVAPTDEGVSRARSATEAFLLPPAGDLAGDRGPIPPQCRVADSVRRQRADGSRSALCRRAAWPSSWTGHNIWTAEEAYRRDRRKDLLLQEHGYFVLRFLARTWAGASTPCSIRSCARCRTAGAIDRVILSGGPCVGHNDRSSSRHGRAAAASFARMAQSERFSSSSETFAKMR